MEMDRATSMGKKGAMGRRKEVTRLYKFPWFGDFFCFHFCSSNGFQCDGLFLFCTPFSFRSTEISYPHFSMALGSNGWRCMLEEEGKRRLNFVHSKYVRDGSVDSARGLPRFCMSKRCANVSMKRQVQFQSGMQPWGSGWDACDET